MACRNNKMHVSASEVLQALRDIELPFDKRRSVRRDDTQGKRGMCLGYVLNYAQGWTASKYTMSNPELSRLLVLFARQRYPDFRFSSIMVNKGGSALHVDKMNDGPSLIVSLGDHIGGDLWQFPNKRLNVRNRICPCDGRLPHITLPYEGERYSLVFFNMKGIQRPGPSPDRYRILKGCGFRKPRIDPENEGHRADLLPAAAAILRKEHGLSRSYIGDYTNKTLKNYVTMHKGSKARDRQ